MKKISYKKFLLDVDSDDETENVCWDDNEKKKNIITAGVATNVYVMITLNALIVDVIVIVMILTMITKLMKMMMI